MQPTSNTTIQRPDLGQVAYEYAFGREFGRFIGRRVLPMFPVSERSGDYPVIPIESVLKVPDTRRAFRGAYNRGDWEFEMKPYSCKGYGWEEPVDDGEAKAYARYLDAEEIAVMRCVNILLRSAEKRVADKVFDEGAFTPHAVSTAWSTHADADPKADVDTGADAIRSQTGIPRQELSLIISHTNFRHITMCASLKDYVKYTNPMLLNTLEAQRQLVAQYLGIREVIVADCVYDAADKGQAHSVTDIWGNTYGMLARLAEQPLDLKEPCLGRTFLWLPDTPGGVGEDGWEALPVDMYREEQTESNVYRVKAHMDERFVFSACGYLLKGLS